MLFRILFLTYFCFLIPRWLRLQKNSHYILDDLSNSKPASPTTFNNCVCCNMWFKISLPHLDPDLEWGFTASTLRMVSIHWSLMTLLLLSLFCHSVNCLAFTTLLHNYVAHFPELRKIRLLRLCCVTKNTSSGTNQDGVYKVTWTNNTQI